jgi:hypothetical protein
VHISTVVAPSLVNDVVLFLYDYASNYGQNVARPFLWRLLQLIGFSQLYVWYVDQLTAHANWITSSDMYDLLTALMLSVQSSFNLLLYFLRSP